MVRGLILGLGWGVLATVTGGATLSLVYSDANRTAVVAEPTEPQIELQNGADTAAPDMAEHQANLEGDDAASIAPASDLPTENQPQENRAQQPEVLPNPDVPNPDLQEASVAGETPQIEMTPDAAALDVDVAGLPKTVAPDPVTPPAPTRKLPEISATPDVPKDDVAKDEESESRFDQTRVSVPKMSNLAPNVRTNRLPSIGGAAVDASQETTQDSGPEPDQGALKSYAMAFDNPDAKPMFSLVLIDDPEHPVSPEMLAHLPFPISFAIDALREDATQVAAKYRTAGFEVVMLTNLPFGATATDVEIAFEAYSHAIPEAVAVLDLGANGFLRGPSTATQIAGIMFDVGYGLITPSKGLNSAQKAAMREGVPAVLLFRELDFDGESVSLIRRYLDRAAFRASQEGSVVMLGHTRPETIEALVTWALDDRAASVAIAPVSAVLSAQ